MKDVMLHVEFGGNCCLCPEMPKNMGDIRLWVNPGTGYKYCAYHAAQFSGIEPHLFREGRYKCADGEFTFRIGPLVPYIPKANGEPHSFVNVPGCLVEAWASNPV